MCTNLASKWSQRTMTYQQHTRVINNIPTIHVPTTKLGQKMIMKIGGNRNSWHQWGEVIVTQNVELFSFWVAGNVGGGRTYCFAIWCAQCVAYMIPNLFPPSLQSVFVDVPNFPKFLMYSQWLPIPYFMHRHILPHVLCPKLYYVGSQKAKTTIHLF